MCVTLFLPMLIGWLWKVIATQITAAMIVMINGWLYLGKDHENESKMHAS